MARVTSHSTSKPVGVQRMPLAQRKHVTLVYASVHELDRPLMALAGAVVKVMLTINEGDAPDLVGLRERILANGAAHIYPIVPTRSEAVAVPIVSRAAVLDPAAALKEYAATNAPPEPIDEILARIGVVR